jgi:HK97 family phage portal protein
VRSLLGSFLNKAPVPLVRRHQDPATLFGKKRTDMRPLEQYGQVGTLFAVVQSLSADVAKIKWRLFTKAASGLDEDRTEVTKHPALDLWNKPNPFMPGQQFRERFSQHIELVGETDWVLSTVRMGGRNVPYEMWPVRPDRITPVEDPFEFIKGYIYTSPDGEQIPLETHEVLRVMMPNPADPYRGLGPVQSIMMDLDSSRYSAEWNRNFFLNSAEPGGIIQVPETLNDPEFNRLRDQWDASHKGVNKAHRVAIIEQGATWASNSFSQRDMQFAELRTVSRDVIMEAFGYPKAMLGITEDVNRANAEAAEYVYAKYRQTPRLDRIKGTLNNDLLPMYGPAAEGLEWDYESPVAENSDARNAAVAANSTALVSLAGAGFDVPAVLEYLGMPEITYTAPPPPTIVAPPGSKGADEEPPADDG